MLIQKLSIFIFFVELREQLEKTRRISGKFIHIASNIAARIFIVSFAI